ncbi:MAG TPA: hypothetical protein VH583_10385 [Vicinamibacterales bacterium]|jgi:hypothetical protein
MRKASLALGVLLAAVLAPAPAYAWGFAGHRLIMAKAIDLLPPPIKPFFEKFRDELVVRAVDPDEWRNVGWDDDPNHFIDFGMPELGPYPFAGLPRDYSQALEKFGPAQMKRIGTLPWRASEMFGYLRRGFEGFARKSPYTNDVVLYAAVASHYVQDANQPLHATNNYDGQLTGNNGIHSRFERDLIERFASRLSLTPSARAPIANARDEAFDMLLAAYKDVDTILAADKRAVAGKDLYDDDYFEKFFGGVKPILERQITRSIEATAAVIAGAWEAAGRPTLTIQEARPVQKVRK